MINSEIDLTENKAFHNVASKSVLSRNTVKTFYLSYIIIYYKTNLFSNKKNI